MSWASLDDQFHANPKIVMAGNAGAGLYVRALSYCGAYLTDGFVPRGWARATGGPKLCSLVEDAGLWISVQGGEMFTYVIDDERYTVTIPGPGYFIEDYVLYNPTRATVEARRDELSQKRREAGQKGARARWSDGKADGKRDSKPDGKSDGKPIATAWQTDSPQPLTPVKEELANAPSSLPDRRLNNELWDALSAEYGEPETPPEKTKRGKTVRDLRNANATADEVRQFAAEYRRRWPDWYESERALVSHWAELKRPPQKTAHVSVTEALRQAGVEYR